MSVTDHIYTLNGNEDTRVFHLTIGLPVSKCNMGFVRSYNQRIRTEFMHTKGFSKITSNRFTTYSTARIQIDELISIYNGDSYQFPMKNIRLDAFRFCSIQTRIYITLLSKLF